MPAANANRDYNDFDLSKVGLIIKGFVTHYSSLEARFLFIKQNDTTLRVFNTANTSSSGTNWFFWIYYTKP